VRVTAVRRHTTDGAESTSLGGGGELGGVRAGAVSQAATRLEERVAELLRRPVVDDGVDARVEVRQAVPQHAHRLRRRISDRSA